MDSAPTRGDEERLARAREVGWRLLARRDHGEAELARKLAKRGFPAEVVAVTIDYFRGLGYLDDRAFAAGQVRRLAIGRGYGDRRLHAFLRERGMPESLAGEAIAAIRREWTEARAVASLIARKTQRRPIKGDPQEKQRLFRYLLGRGFPPGLICEQINRAEEVEGHDDDGE
ncbi:MAG: regulatory protein RecX [Pseudomonadota bacterium]|nr:regulatory protein RecX [Pseudomonadota bacterium]